MTMMKDMYIPFLELSDLPYVDATQQVQEFAASRIGIPIYVEVAIFDTNHNYPIDGTYIMQVYGWYTEDGSIMVKEEKLGEMFNTSGIEKSDFEDDYGSVFTEEQLAAMPESIPHVFYLCNEDHIISVGQGLAMDMSNSQKKYALDREAMLEGAV